MRSPVSVMQQTAGVHHIVHFQDARLANLRHNLKNLKAMSETCVHPKASSDDVARPGIPQPPLQAAPPQQASMTRHSSKTVMVAHSKYAARSPPA